MKRQPANSILLIVLIAACSPDTDPKLAVNPIEIDNPAFIPEISWNSTTGQYAMAWIGTSEAGNAHVYFSMLSPTGEFLREPQQVSSEDGYISNPEIVWNEDFDGDTYVFFSILDSSGNPVVSPMPVSDPMEYESYPSIAWNGTVFGIVWTDNAGYDDYADRDLYYRAITADGSPYTPIVRLTSFQDTKLYPQILSTADTFALFWEDHRELGANIYYGRVDSSGNPLILPTNVSNDADAMGFPKAVWTGSELIFFWASEGDSGYINIRSSRISLDGTFLGGPFTLNPDHPLSAHNVLEWNGGYEMTYNSLFDAQWHGTSYSLVWTSIDEYTFKVQWRLFNADGTALSPPLVLTSSEQYSAFPKVASNDIDTSIVWSDLSTGIGYYSKIPDCRY